MNIIFLLVFLSCEAKESELDCKIGEWRSWGQCSRSCGGGERSRNRYFALVDGKDCGDGGSQSEECETHTCPVHCEWDEWMNWHPCSFSCGSGTQTRSRDKRRQADFGGDCVGAYTDVRECNTRPCPGAYSIVKLDHECGSSDKKLAYAHSVDECALHCFATPGCKYFILGKKSWEKYCYQEYTKTEECTEGWNVYEFDFYVLHGTEPYLIIRQGRACKSDDTLLGYEDTVGACAARCHRTPACKYFIFSTEKNRHDCYQEHTATELCEEGWGSTGWDFYQITGDHYVSNCGHMVTRDACVSSIDSRPHYSNQPCIWCCGYRCADSKHRCEPLNFIRGQHQWDGRGEHTGVMYDCDRTFSMIKRGRVCKSREISLSTEEEDVGACAYECFRTPKCKYFVYSTNSRECFQDNASTVSMECPERWQVEASDTFRLDSTEQPYALVTGGSQCRRDKVLPGEGDGAEACAGRCRNTTGCNYFLYGTGTGPCYQARTNTAECETDPEQHGYDLYKIAGATCDALIDPPESSRSYSSVYLNKATHNKSQLSSTNAWCAGVNDTFPHMIIDLKKTELVSGIAVAGRNSHIYEQYVTLYNVEVRFSTASWEKVGVFHGERAQTTKMFDAVQKARYVKITARAWVGFASMRIGVLLKIRCERAKPYWVSRCNEQETAADCVNSLDTRTAYFNEPCIWCCGKACTDGGDKCEPQGWLEKQDDWDRRGEHTDVMSKCDVDCEWAEWPSWSDCTTTCGPGTKSRSRIEKTEVKGNGEACFGSSRSSETCNIEDCPVDCVWDSWTQWDDCTATCGPGTKYRSRVKKTEVKGRGRDCVGSSHLNEDCNLRVCSADCAWGYWTQWDDCTATCGPGTKYRSRVKFGATGNGEDCVGSSTSSEECNIEDCPVNCAWDSWSTWGVCDVPCKNGKKSRTRTIMTERKGTGMACRGGSKGVHACYAGECPIHCEWDAWSKWSSECEGECGRTTAKRYRLRMFKVEAKYDGNPCSGESIESESCNFPACPLRMKCEGEVLGTPTEKILSEGKVNCHKQCRRKCTEEELCADIRPHRGEAWHDPSWAPRWLGAPFNKFVSEIALIESFSYPKMALSEAASDATGASCLWLIPTCADKTSCDFGHAFPRQNVSHIMNNFYHWYFSEAVVDGQTRDGGMRKEMLVGGRNMRQQDMTGPGKCKRRCKIWCYEACKCNWSWEFPYSNDQDLGWRHKKPMRYRWVRSEVSSPSYGTWKCVSSHNVALAVPWDSPWWSIDLYSEAVKREAQRRFVASGSLSDRPLEYRLVCLHVRDLYSRAINRGKTDAVVTPLNCTRAPAVVITYLHEKNMLQDAYMESSKKRKKLTATLRNDIHKNCRRTCAEAHAADFETCYPNV